MTVIQFYLWYSGKCPKTGQKDCQRSFRKTAAISMSENKWLLEKFAAYRIRRSLINASFAIDSSGGKVNVLRLNTTKTGRYIRVIAK